jgi:hypothetical protein
MASIKPSVSLSDWSQAVLSRYGTRTETGPGLSPVINSVLERYDWLMRQSLPELSNQQWQTLLNVYSGSEMTSYNPPYRVASDILDCFGVLELSELDQPVADLARMCHGMTQAQQCAILDACQRFWSAGSNAMQEGETLTDAIKRLMKTVIGERN